MQNCCNIRCTFMMRTCAAVLLKIPHSPGGVPAIQAMLLQAASTMPAMPLSAV